MNKRTEGRKKKWIKRKLLLMKYENQKEENIEKKIKRWANTEENGEEWNAMKRKKITRRRGGDYNKVEREEMDERDGRRRREGSLGGEDGKGGRKKRRRKTR